jgi:hypothetical protein
MDVLKLLVESVSEFRLTGRCLEPTTAFAELGFPQSLSPQGEQEEFRLWADSLFWRQTDQPSGYDFSPVCTRMPPSICRRRWPNSLRRNGASACSVG